jgi:hypothetical protein
MCKSIQDHVNIVRSTLEGNVIPNDLMIRVQSQLFSFTLPNHNILDIKSNIANQVIIEGSWIFIQRL